MSPHLIVLPVVLPLIAGVLLLRTRHGSPRTKRWLGVGATLALVAVSALLVGRTEGPRFLDSELSQLQRLATIAVRMEVLAAGGSGRNALAG